ncbi:hypothetical protein ACIQ34_12195 [Ureibacillus sp. NPDC094379]
MKSKKMRLGAFMAILSIGLLFGCGTTNDDEQGSETDDRNSEEENHRKVF